MFLIDDKLHWSASDLITAAECEYALLRSVDDVLGRSPKVAAAEDPLQAHIARLGIAHEERILTSWQQDRDVAVLDHVPAPFSRGGIDSARSVTLAAFRSDTDVLYQATFCDGEFFGYADFVERVDDGWRVCDAKIARSAKPKALIQLGAYADQIQRAGLPLSSTVSLLLGDGVRADFPVADVLPVFEERRERLRALIAEHRARGVAVTWGDDRYVACNRCPECERAATDANDLILVAGLRTEQRRKFRSCGVHAVGELASATASPAGMRQATFDQLRSQAAMQWRQMQAGGDVSYELIDGAAKTLSRLPAPSPGDLFFDFEGDPLYDEGDPTRAGLEYLWGVLDTDEVYTATWAHSVAEEREAFVTFMDDLAARRSADPDMHVYHYAPYETTALKRLAMRYQTKEKELDDLLRSEVFVDLYATVRGSVRVSQPSYSIKKLEPLYMGDQLRESDVADGAGSIVAYVEYRDLRETDTLEADRRLVSLADYNEYDCLSTLRLRDWLLERAAEAGVRDQIGPRAIDEQGEELSEHDPLFVTLMARSGPEQRLDRTAEEQAYAMLATSLDYYRRERKQFWWEHFERLNHPISEWSESRDVFVVEAAEVLVDWAVPEGKAKNLRRTLRLVGDWAPGSAPSAQVQVVYPTPAPPRSKGPEGAPFASAAVAALEADADDPRIVLLTESRPAADTFADLPCALVPGFPPQTKSIEEAIAEVAERAASAHSLPCTSALDLLARRTPRLDRAGAALPHHESQIDNIVDALRSMSNSYVAVQGPPGTGKTYSGSRVIKRLVEEDGWRIGIVAQSHAVVENMLAGVVKAGLDPALVGKDKKKTQSPNPTWSLVDKASNYIDEHANTGCVVGGTVWDLTNEKTVPRGSLDLLVVDEAGQFSLAPTLAASVAADRLLLLGDPQQLPQVSQGTHAEPVDESALGWIMGEHDTLPRDHGYFLAETYRMHPALCEPVSALSYDGELQPAPAAGERRLDGVEAGIGVVSLPHSGNRTHSSEEADAIVAEVQRLLGRGWTDPDDASTPRGLVEGDFLVVAPYNAQVMCIREALAGAGLSGVRVGTVDKFQGQEAPVVLVSMAASSHGDVPRGMGFLLSRNRVNVAVSRAKWRAVIVRSDAFTAFMPSSVQGLLELGAFIGLCRPDARTTSASTQ
ncbi:TM0106 family RecB-like putative nuclease [Janibacter cremeus]|uniref:TM0106 family RecB-like putative nuclease n=1 Tax=Janibacter cremeus TaxID=1285192 RepID=UPI0023F798BA|nr:bifunctional RecB family nuclease/DEAD/DEAH box helicase [Janibacter cremeus]WEV78815.1 TM0106 family RecB-like putative nuclease [Janibacter cremeus]